MIFGIAGTLFSSTVYLSGVVYMSGRFQPAVELGFLDDFLGPRVLVFVNGF
jgi:hypothetical protein